MLVGQAREQLEREYLALLLPPRHINVHTVKFVSSSMLLKEESGIEKRLDGRRLVMLVRDT